MITLYHHPQSRAAGVLWGLEEVGVPYELVYVDLRAGAQKAPPVSTLNPMGKIPVLVDGDTVVTEAAAIALYLGDRYGLGTLAPACDDPRRGTYLRWALFAPSVIEPGAVAKGSGWPATASRVGWGDYEAMERTIDGAIATGPFVLGDMFSMADVIFGITLRYLVRFQMLASTPAVTAYLARIAARPALQRADAKNAEVMQAHGLG